MSSGKYTNKSTFGGTVVNGDATVLAIGDIVDMLFVPAGEEVTVYGGQALIKVKGTAGDTIDFIEVTNADAIWASAAIDAADDSVVEMTPDNTQTGGTTYPFDIPSSTSDRIFAMQIATGLTAGALYSASMHHSNIKKS